MKEPTLIRFEVSEQERKHLELNAPTQLRTVSDCARWAFERGLKSIGYVAGAPPQQPEEQRAAAPSGE